MEKLGIRIRQAEFEPAWSLLQRLTALHGFPSVNQFCNHHDLRLWSMTQKKTVRQLADMSDVDGDSLVHYSPIKTSDTHFQLGNEQVQWAGSNPALFKLQKVLVCPSCLVEDHSSSSGRSEFRSHYRSWWSFPSLTNCPIHNVEMIATSPRDGTLLSPQVPDPTTAGTDFDLKTAPARSANADFERYVVGRLGYTPRILNDLLDKLTLSEAITFVFRVGFTLVEGRQERMPISVKTDRMRVWNAAGWEYLKDGEIGLNNLLTDLLKSSPRTNGLASLDQAFGKFYLWLLQEQRFGADRYVAVVEHWAPFVKEAFPTTKANGALRQRDDDPRNVTISQASIQLNIAKRKLQKIIRGCDFIPKRGNSQPILTVTQVEQLRAYTEALIPAPDLVRDYGIARRTLNTLVEIGILKPDLRLGSGDELIFLPETVDKWWERMTQGAPTVSALNDDLIPLVRTKQEVQVGIEISALMLNRRQIACKGILQGVPRFDSILVSKGELFDHILPGRHDYYDRSEARDVIGVSRVSLLSLIAGGHLTEHSFDRVIGVKRTLFRYAKNEVEAFAGKYAGGVEANKLLKQRNSRGTTTTFGIKAAIVFEERDATSFFLRSDIEKALAG